jgi:hypothetical protein
MAKRRKRAGYTALVVAALAMAALGLVLPTPATAAEGDVATTTTLTVTRPSGNLDPDRLLQAAVTSAAAIAPTGTAVFSIDGAEVGRAPVRPGGSTISFATLLLAMPIGADQLVTVDYLGAPGYAPSSNALEVDVTGPTSGTPASGEVRIGDSVLPLTPPTPFLRTPLISDPITGLASTALSRTEMAITEDVPGTGPVTAWFDLRGAVDLDLASDGSVTGSMTVLIAPRRLLVDGTVWEATCTGSGLGNISAPATGAFSGNVLEAQASFVAPAALPSTDCRGFGDLVSAVLARPFEIEFETEGTFPTPLPEGTATTPTLSVAGTSWDEQSALRISTEVTSALGPVTLGTVVLSLDGQVLFTRQARVTAPYTYLGPLSPGPHEISLAYTGASPFADSTVTRTLIVDPAPDGPELTGTLGFSQASTSLPAGSKASGGSFDPETGALSDLELWTPRGSISVNAPVVGRIDVVYRLRLDSPVDGLVQPDGTAVLDPASLRIEVLGWGYTGVNPPLNVLDTCELGPLAATFTGTATIDGLTVRAEDVAIPPLPSGACSGLGGFITPQLGNQVDIELSVAGDFRAGVEATELAVSSWQPTIEQHNQTLLVATATAESTPGGTIAFYDGDTHLGDATLDTNGNAIAAVTLDQPGTRTIDARYLGDPTHQRTTATTTVEVLPAPDGLTLDGTLSIGTTQLPIAEGSTLEPQGGLTAGTAPADAMADAVERPGARLWFTPTTTALTVPGYGPATAELRLVQNGRMNPTDIAPDGTFTGLFGAYALHIRSVTTPDGTTVRPLGCVNIVLLILDGQLRITDAQLDTAGGGNARYRNTACTGIGRAVANTLANRTVDLQATIDY